jgi:hypothetical protein
MNLWKAVFLVPRMVIVVQVAVVLLGASRFERSEAWTGCKKSHFHIHFEEFYGLYALTASDTSGMPDTAFGNLIRDWLKTLVSARHDVEQLRFAFSATPTGPARDKTCDDLALLCNKIYGQVLRVESGFSHREEISRYSQWEEVIQAIAPSMRHW